MRGVAAATRCEFQKRDVDRYATLLPLVSMPEAKTDENSDPAKEKCKWILDKGREQLRPRP